MKAISRCSGVLVVQVVDRECETERLGYVEGLCERVGTVLGQAQGIADKVLFLFRGYDQEATLQELRNKIRREKKRKHII